VVELAKLDIARLAGLLAITVLKEHPSVVVIQICVLALVCSEVPG